MYDISRETTGCSQWNEYIVDGSRALIIAGILLLVDSVLLFEFFFKSIHNKSN